MPTRSLTGNFYIIRRRPYRDDSDVLGLVDFDKIGTPDLDEYPSLNFTVVVEWNLNLYSSEWYSEPITQAEFETYRDLHQFPVLKRCTLNEHREWLRVRRSGVEC